MQENDTQDSEIFDESATQVVELGNTIMEQKGEEMIWAVASGMLAGAIQFWLYSRQPCEDPECEECTPYSTAELRQEELMDEVMQFLLSSEYLHSPNDRDVGRA